MRICSTQGWWTFDWTPLGAADLPAAQPAKPLPPFTSTISRFMCNWFLRERVWRLELCHVTELFGFHRYCIYKQIFPKEQGRHPRTKNASMQSGHLKSYAYGRYHITKVQRPRETSFARARRSRRITASAEGRQSLNLVYGVSSHLPMRWIKSPLTWRRISNHNLHRRLARRVAPHCMGNIEQENCIICPSDQHTRVSNHFTDTGEPQKHSSA
jgi:hypothetical protein